MCNEGEENREERKLTQHCESIPGAPGALAQVLRRETRNSLATRSDPSSGMAAVSGFVS